MIRLDASHLMMFEAQCIASVIPIIDYYTYRMIWLWRNRKVGCKRTGLFQHCSCGLKSDDMNHQINLNGKWLRTHSLAVHVIAYHRECVYKSELVKLDTFKHPRYKELNPSLLELRGALNDYP